ncbi:sigma-70 family RNA polymerase sigma factor [Streptomyces sp. NBC_01275]|uniref:sigma-70 family RNA polymerase sigma factor n=1 Tax=Streptomyces sp. NBC_01275 TaxID=2903807 RepID=UPI00224DEED3|nr:sigma-70 family RNA polymerase sigma factor [Streptomyces sp. NBC_01275]MCX4766461.1 sigma-70 family RNA polymerase sigma factor [Streptomyces sp. NBC_01275]
MTPALQQTQQTQQTEQMQQIQQTQQKRQTHEKHQARQKHQTHHKSRHGSKVDQHAKDRRSSAYAAADETTTALALAARSGDADAVEQFVRALHRDVLRYVAHLCADPQAVDDLAQDTFLRALGSLHRFEGRCSARVWLLSIARRAVIDSYRYAAGRPRLSDVADWQLAVELAQPRGLPGFDDGVALLDLLAALPRDRREAFVLTQLLGLPYAEAAELTACPVGTVRSRVARARATLTDLVTAATAAAAPTPS